MVRKKVEVIHRCSVACCCPIHQKYMQFESTTRIHFCRRPHCLFGIGVTLEQIMTYTYYKESDFPLKGHWECARVRIELMSKFVDVVENLFGEDNERPGT